MKYLVLALLVLVAACSETKPESPRIQVVRVAQVFAGGDAPSLDVVGTIQLRRTAQLGFTTGGRVASIRVDEGERVRRGQLIAALEATPVASSAAAAAAERQRARGELGRMEQLFAKGWVTKARLENARAANDAAAANLRATQFLAATANVYASGDGVVLARLVEQGQVVAAGTTIVEIGDERGGYVLRAPIADRDAAGLAIGAPATVRIAALGGQPIIGRVVEIGGRADPATGTFAIEVALPAGGGLRAGQIGQLSIAMSGRASPTGVTVPAAAIFAPRAGEALVYIARPGQARLRLRRVKIAEARDQGISVESGIGEGEWVVVSAVDRLKNGQTVNAIARSQ